MLQHIMVELDDVEPASAALRTAADLARQTLARLTIVHVAPAVDEPLDERQALHIELLGASEAARRRQRLVGAAALAASGVPREVRVLTGSRSEQLQELIRREQPDLLVVGRPEGRGARRLRVPGVSDGVLARARCPVMLVGDAPIGSPKSRLGAASSAAGARLRRARGTTAPRMRRAGA